MGLALGMPGDCWRSLGAACRALFALSSRRHGSNLSALSLRGLFHRRRNNAGYVIGGRGPVRYMCCYARSRRAAVWRVAVWRLFS